MFKQRILFKHQLRHEDVGFINEFGFIDYRSFYFLFEKYICVMYMSYLIANCTNNMDYQISR